MSTLLEEREETQVQPKRPYRVYTDDERQTALAVLKFHRGNYHAASRALEIPVKTIENWDKERCQVGASAKLGTEEKERLLADTLIDIAREAAAAAPGKIEKAQFLPTMLGICAAVDKSRLIRGASTANVEHKVVIEAYRGLVERFGRTPEEARQIVAERFQLPASEVEKLDASE